MYLKLRAHVDCVSKSELESFYTAVSAKCKKFIVYCHPKEEAEREHIHALLCETTLSEKVLRDWCSQKLKLDKSNKNYSVGSTYSKNIKISDFTYSKYITYMTKGKYDPVFNHGYEDSLIQTLKSEWKAMTKTEVVFQLEKITPVKKLTQYGVGKEAEIRYLERFGDSDIDYRRMGEIVIETLHENHTLAHDNTVVHILQDIQARNEPDRFMTRVLKRLDL